MHIFVLKNLLSCLSYMFRYVMFSIFRENLLAFAQNHLLSSVCCVCYICCAIQYNMYNFFFYVRVTVHRDKFL